MRELAFLHIEALGDRFLGQMIVQIGNPSSGLLEFGLVELQGEILGDTLNGALGEVSISGKVAVLEIGQHVLEGTVLVLKQPYLVVEKGASGVNVAGLVRTKLIFSSRPKNKKLTTASA